jgi:hypothetical protein
VLCTRCSSVVKPLVAVDIDGTLGDYHTHFLNFAREYLGPNYWIPCHSLAYDGSTGFKDDLPEQYDAAAVAFGATVPVLRRNGYNFGVSRPATAQTLEEAAHLFVKRLEHWRERNG